MAYETVFIAVIILLLAVICFLLYKLYTIKYNEGKGVGLIPESWKNDINGLDSGKTREIETRLGDMDSRVSEIERRIEREGKVVEKLVRELS
jgi:hypothetical protein